MEILLLIPGLFTVAWVIWLLSAGIIHFSSKHMGLKKDYSQYPTVSVLISAYNEGSTIYKTIESISQSAYPSDKLEILVFDDCSTDDTFSWIQKAQADFPNVRGFLNETNQGKGKTILTAVEKSSSDIIVTVDSDVIVDKNAIRELTACFSDPKIGLVGGVVGLTNPNENSLTTFQVYIYYVFFRLARIPEAYLKSVACVSGCLSAIRRTVFEEIRPAIEKRNFLGVPVRYGEDRFVTHQTLLRGYQTYINMKAKCWTPAPATFKSFWGQQLRWRRSGTADFIQTVGSLHRNVKTVGMAAMYTYFFTPLSIFLLIIVIASTPFSYFFTETVLRKGAYYVAICSLAIWAINRFHVEQKVHRNPLRVLLFGGWGLVKTVFMLPSALFTLDSDGWGGARDQAPEPSKGQS